MKIRVFACEWTFETIEGQHYVSNPVLDQISTLTEPNISTWMIYPQNNPAIRNTCNLVKSMVLVFVRAENNFNFNQLLQLPDVVALPAFSPATDIVNIPQIALDNMRADLSTLGINYIEGNKWSRTLKNIASNVNPAQSIDRVLTELVFD